jgi:hypothetical protein
VRVRVDEAGQHGAPRHVGGRVGRGRTCRRPGPRDHPVLDDQGGTLERGEADGPPSGYGTIRGQRGLVQSAAARRVGDELTDPGDQQGAGNDVAG